MSYVGGGGGGGEGPKISPSDPQVRSETYPSANSFLPQDYRQLFNLFIEMQCQL